MKKSRSFAIATLGALCLLSSSCSLDVPQATELSDLNTFPSPYLTGQFDALIRENPNTEFCAVVETNRGCPNHCAYCSWANNKARVRLVPLERVYSDLTWISEHKMEFPSWMRRKESFSRLSPLC